jgi:hypothetical protein
MNKQNFWMDTEKVIKNHRGMKRKVIDKMDRYVE